MVYIYSTIIGHFVFDDSIIDHNKDKNTLLKKHPDARVPSTKDIQNLLKLLKDSRYYPEFTKANIRLTRSQIKEAVSDDMLVIQVVNTIQELDKVANTLSKRVREWYELYLPEVSHAISDHEAFLRNITTKDRETILAEIDTTEEHSMGRLLPQVDLDAMLTFATHAYRSNLLRSDLAIYLEKLMARTAPNIAAVAGVMVGAKLIAQAGSLQRLSRFPASTIQLLGAEKALFRHMKTGSRPPKHGIILQHPAVSSVRVKTRGKAARIVADKIAIAAKVDYFKGEFIGDQLLSEIQEKIAS